jgi:hypothetical protein
VNSAGLRETLAELGPLLGLAEVVEFATHNLWTLAFDDGDVVEVELDDVHQRVVFCMDVCDLPGEDLARHARTLLQANLLWRQTGGVRFALAEPTVVQMFELPLDRADLSTLATALRNLHVNARLWRAILTAVPTAAAPSDSYGAMRV